MAAAMATIVHFAVDMRRVVNPTFPLATKPATTVLIDAGDENGIILENNVRETCTASFPSTDVFASVFNDNPRQLSLWTQCGFFEFQLLDNDR